MSTLLPLGLYIHLPFCLSKCPYCDFNSYTSHENLKQSEYIRALICDLEQDLKDYPAGNRPLHSIFIGGGTPSLFEPEHLARLFTYLYARFSFEQELEITLEANPGTLTQAKLNTYRTLGINRLSIGVQSFNDQSLKAIGRKHDATEARQAMHMAQQAGFENINIDLMFALPGQTYTMALADLAEAISLQPAHLSWYQLTLEPDTIFARSPPQLPSDDAIWAIQEAGSMHLEQAGYQHYEVSAYSMLSQACKHNLNYWQFGDYLGIGAGAHSKLSLHSEEGLHIKRMAKHAHPGLYTKKALQGHAADTITHPDDVQRIFEFMINALRLRQGVSFCMFTKRTGLTTKLLEPMLQQARDLGLLEASTTHLIPSTKGRHFLNDLLALFLFPKN